MARPFDKPDPGQDVVAILGPTNTGKTHRAIEEMLRHPTGMIGLPLRLLAREVYDRVSAQVGEGAVALVTGEEKRVPEDPRFHVCTVEAMPVQREVSFLGVDEIQLAGHRDRGHVFTDRLLRARGTRTTAFMGSDTAGPLIQRLVPEARVEHHDRFSRLSYTGPRRLLALPPRCAVIAFTASDVYEIADRLRDRHGGAAVVLGALSPRARNAQVAMYQAGEVQYLVATDAIGMGLNLDLDQVAFSALGKWDGHDHRPLTHAEVGQIAGRAGRFRRDGRFGPLSSVGAFPADMVDEVQRHQFAPLRRLRWRNPDLDFTSIDDLLASLAVPPPRQCLRSSPRGSDHRALAALAREEPVVALLTTRRRLRLLWDVCGIPDYPREPGDGHAGLLGAVFRQLVEGKLADDWLRTRVERLDRTDGDMEHLMGRIAHIRSFSYVAQRAAWVDDPLAWRARTRAVEDRLSDALHERLSQRFVDRRAVVVLGPGAVTPEVSAEGVVTAAGQPMGHLHGFDFLPAAGLSQAGQVRRALLTMLDDELQDRVQRCVEADHAEFELDDQGRVLWDGADLARLAAGPSPLEPRIRMVRLDLLGAGARQRLERRLRAWQQDLFARLFAPLRPATPPRPGPRGLLYQLELGLGTVDRASAQDQLRTLGRGDKRALARMGVRIGSRFVFSAQMLQPQSIAERAVLAGLVHVRGTLPGPPPPGATTVVSDRKVPRAWYTAIGFPVIGGIGLRVDLLERLVSRVHALGRSRAPFDLPEDVLEWIGCRRSVLGQLIEGLGFVRTDGDRFTRPPRRRRSARRRRR